MITGPYNKGYNFSGLSTDTKPAVNVPYGAIFEETNTGDEYTYNGSWYLSRKFSFNKVWDTSTLSWVVMTQPLIKTDTLTVSSTTDLTKIGGVVVGAGNALYVRPGTNAKFSAAEDNKNTVVYIDEDIFYICKAEINTLLGSALWQVRRVETDTNIVIKWAGGNDLYDNVATSLAVVKAFTYS